MAITVSLLGTPTFTTASGTKTVTATPAVGDLIVIITAHSGNTSTAAPTDNQTGGTYTLINTAVKATSADTMKAWVRDNLITSATSTVFTHAPGTTTGGGLVVIKCVGMDKAGASAVVRSAIQSNIASGTPAPVLGATPSSANAIVGAVFNASNPAALTPRSGYTELYDSGYNTPATGLEVMADNSGETSATITWGGTSPSAFASIAFELNSLLTHANTGTLTGQIGSVAGSAKHNIPHQTTGTLTGQIGSVVGSATRYRAFSTSGTLTGQGSTVTGSADRQSAIVAHTSTSALTGQGSTVTGSATNFTVFTSSGALTGQIGSITGDADHERLIVPHTTDGTLTGQGSTLSGSSTRYRQFSTTGTLNGQVATITGSALHNIPHATTGSLTGQDSVIVGDADHVSLTHDVSGDLVAQGAIVTGKASRPSSEVTGSKNIRPKPSIIVVEVDGKEYRVPVAQLQSFLDTVQKKVEDTTPVKKKRKKRSKKAVEVVEVKELPQIVIKSAPVSIIPQIQNRVDEVNSIIANSFSKALQQYLQNIELDNVKIEIAKKQAIQDEEEWLLMIL